MRRFLWPLIAALFLFSTPVSAEEENVWALVVVGKVKASNEVKYLTKFHVDEMSCYQSMALALNAIAAQNFSHFGVDCVKLKMHKVPEAA